MADRVIFLLCKERLALIIACDSVLLFLPCGGFLPHRLPAGGDLFFKISFRLLHRGIPDSGRGAAGPRGMRISVPLRLVSGTAAQDPFPEREHQKAAVSHLFIEISRQRERKKSMKKALCLFLSFAACTAVLAGCGAGSQESET